jgi:hypothetical protein
MKLPVLSAIAAAVVSVLALAHEADKSAKPRAKAAFSKYGYQPPPVSAEGSSAERTAEPKDGGEHKKAEPTGKKSFR